MNRKYHENKRQIVMADKFLDNKWGTWNNAAGGSGWGDDEWEGADGDNNGLRISQPYIISVRNNYDDVVNNIVIGDSYDNRTANNYGNPGTIVITYYIPPITYVGWLAQTETQPFNVGRTMIVSTVATNLSKTITVTHKDATGDQTSHVIPPIIDPYQDQTDRVLDEYEYLFDGYTSLTINQMRASSNILIYLFPISKFSSVQSVAGRATNETFNAPAIIKVAPVAVPRPQNLIS